ncbi:MAG: molybdopterin converting factor subunit 1 [Candidatus Latescibacteria bacterium]|nr:molybdopterin converting factor subunit 1 [Candidatus Latescibacterota bacterium]
MKIQLLLFASCRDAVGAKELVLDLPEGTTAAGLRDEVVSRYPRLAPLKEKLLIAANAEYVDGATVLKDGDEIALIPPVSGG